LSLCEVVIDRVSIFLPGVGCEMRIIFIEYLTENEAEVKQRGYSSVVEHSTEIEGSPDQTWETPNSAQNVQRAKEMEIRQVFK
jgi:hypothetical protein